MINFSNCISEFYNLNAQVVYIGSIDGARDTSRYARGETLAGHVHIAELPRAQTRCRGEIHLRNVLHEPVASP